MYTSQHTLIKDLRISEEQLFNSLGKHLRQYIKRSRKDEGVEIKIFDSMNIRDNRNILPQLEQLFEKMFSDKGRPTKFNWSLAEKYLDLDALTVGIAFFESKPIGFSAIIHEKQHARLWLSAFDFRDDQNDSQVFSRAHQRLDWELICWCKDAGIETFDFGGVNSFDDPNGIAQFKLKFESQNKVTYQNYLVPRTLLGKIALKYFMRGRV